MNEEFVARIRAAATDTPSVRIDRAHVLRAGRRRRAGRVVGGVGLTGLLMAGTVTAVASLGPSGPQAPAAPSTDAASPSPRATDVPVDEPYGPVEVVAGAADVDTETGVIRLPVEANWLTADEWDVVGTAQDVFLDGCFETAGYGEYFSPGDAPFLQDMAARHARETERYGVWREADVRVNGYGGAMAQWGGPEDEVLDGLPFTEDMAAASRGCYRAMLDAGLSWEPATVTADAPLGLPPVYEMPEARPVIDEWAECLADAGVAPPRDADSVLVPGDVWDASFDEEVEIGLVDVACKAQVDLVQRLADVEAAYQLAYLERGREWVEEYAALQQRTLRAAEAYLATAEGSDD